MGLCAFCVLSYEIALTRIFSVLFRSPYVFLILSAAVCGLGLGAAFAAWQARDRRPRGLFGPAIALAAALPLPLLLMLTVLDGLVAGANAVGLIGLTTLPYLAAGVLLARAFAAFADESGRLYFFDLGGAALAAMSTGWVLSRLGGLTVPFGLGLLASLAALSLAWPLGRPGPRLAAGLLVAACGGLVGWQLSPRRLDLPPITSQDALRVKPLFQELADPAAGAIVRYTEWSAVARTDVVSNTGTDTLFIWTDGDVPTQMEPYGGNLESMADYRRFLGYLPYALQPNPERVLCIGPGGGLDLLLALLGGAREIEPVELNPAITRVTEQFRSFYGDLYRRPEVSPGLIIDEGRSYLSRSTRQYDVIYFALAKSATTQQGGLALVDNYLYTTEAFEAYFDRLAPGGLLCLIMQDENIVDRCLVTAVEVLMRRGVSGAEIADRLLMLQIPPEAPAGPYRRALLIRNGAFGLEHINRLGAFGREAGLMPNFVPKSYEAPPYDTLRGAAEPDALLTAIESQGKYLVRPYQGADFVRLTLRPVTDDSPFYADFAPGLHPDLARLLKGGLLAGLLAMVLVGLLAGGRVSGSAELRERGLFVVYFSGLGAGYLMVEVALIQKLVLLLGYPTLSLTVSLFAVLLGSAVGGWVANRGDAAAAARRLTWPVLGLVVSLALLGALPLTERLTTALLPQGVPVRAAAAALLVGLLGFLMGQPFPTGLRWLGAVNPGLVPAAWAVNGILSVTGSVLAAAIASEAGYRAVLLVGACVYLGCGVAGRLWMRAPSPLAVAADGASDDG